MSLCKDLIFLILQFCDEENLKRTAHMLEQETGYFFDQIYFEKLVLHGNWEEVEKYLSSFTVVDDNKYSTKIYFEIRKQKFLEALDKHEYAVALDILLKDLKAFAQSNKELYKEMTQLLTLDDFREHSSLTLYGDVLSARKRIVNELRIVIEANPLLHGRTRYPQINKSRLRRLINQSLNWQHIHCAHPHSQPHIDTLFTDHKCPGPDSMQVQCGNENSFVASSTEISSCCRVNEFPREFPRTLGRILNMGSSSPSAMDFHPAHETTLLVGKSNGDIELWDVSSSEKLYKNEFMFWKVKSVSGVLQEDVEKYPGISVNRVLWSPDGCLFGVAYSKCIIHLYSFRKNGNHSEKQLEINAHVGSVNDLAYSEPYDKLVVISCGDDTLIQVWDAVTGTKQYTFEGHGAPVYSLCPHVEENVHFLFSISTNGEIKAWLFDNLGSSVTYSCPGFCCMRMAYSTDGKRLFSCGTNNNGESYIVEWCESEGSIIRNYQGLSKCSSAMVQFDTSHNRFLAAGDDHLIKIWDVDNAEVLAITNAYGGLPATPMVCFSKKGDLLAVSAYNNQVKVMANDHGHELLQNFAPVSGSLAESLRKIPEISVPVPLKSVTTEDVNSEEATDELAKVKLPKGSTESTKFRCPSTSNIVQVSRCQSMLLTSAVKVNMIRRLVYTHAGNGILALADDGTHLLWRWVKRGDNLSGEATMMCAPQLWKPKSGLLMINDLPGNSLDVVKPCFSLSRNDSYVISASGRVVSLYNMLIFKKIKNVMPSPPAATSIIFFPPDNNIIAVGMDDATILIYNIRVDEIISKLQGHSKRISGLAFSIASGVLVSCGVDTQIVSWDTLTWEKKRSTSLQISVGWLASELPLSSPETSIQLNKDEKHLLAVQEAQLAICEVTTLRCVKQWTVAKFCTRILHATYSCDSQLVCASMRDGILLILGASDLAPRFEIDPTAYLAHQPSYEDPVVVLVVAAHPHKPCQFALGLSSGAVVVIEPFEGKWTALSTPIIPFGQ